MERRTSTQDSETTWKVVAPRRKRRRQGPTPRTSPACPAAEDSFFERALQGDHEDDSNDDNNGDDNGDDKKVNNHSNENKNSGDEKRDNNNPQKKKESGTDREEES